MREKNSERVAALDLKQPVTELVMVTDPGFSTPRITMHMCLGRRGWQAGGGIGFEERGRETGEGSKTGSKHSSQPETETHVASMTTATPRGWMASLMACAICLVSRS